ncbi:beta-N-acetylhexosaminidase [Heyndrickxia shackletonii]|uniref:beta-N-acetylhexosaminidase n=1 Tax=Heyndrickxia shackletonii TaxID=157838 RepID=A0A0Q3TJS9_9BACI|nr:glycoside hydrolase family 3 protein [Heyndrickxia shackletonii]KQL54240.1 beta-N-acetylhexosaminidase [Heyndrickxia shackletonii]NEZ00925.1 glycoside hydrolase family 3 protein [Heyndrickxia shackletonii]
MKKLVKIFSFSIIIFTFILTGVPEWGANKAKADEPSSTKLNDLVIDLNVPQVSRDVLNNKLKLNALHVYSDGNFLLANKNITWKSSNKNVASVDPSGEVTLLGHNGKTFIYATDGNYQDRISIQYKGNQDKIIVEKEHGKRYDIIGKAINHMTVPEKVGQMLMPDFRTWKGKNVTEMQPEIAQLIKQYHIGGVILFRENTVTADQTIRLTRAYQDAAEKYGMLISVDQEGGIVTRLQTGTDFPGNMALGATRSEELAGKVGKVIGEELEADGINMDFGPVMDVNVNPDNPVIGVRSFGADPQLVADLGKAYLNGLHQTNTASTAKHFPGHGDTAVDSHLGLPEVPYDMDRLKQVELYPFQQAMNAGIDAIMTAHVTFPKIDDTKVISQKDGTEISLPATLSYKVLTGLIRGQMDFKGVIVTDAMNMGAIVDNFGPVDAAIRAVNAGADILLMPVGVEQVANGLYNAVYSGAIPVTRIDQSVERILTLKLNRSIVKPEVEKNIDDQVANALKVVGSPEHKQIEKEVAAKSITLVKNDHLLPLNVAKEDKIAVVGYSGYYVQSLVDEVKKHHNNVTYINTSTTLTKAQLDQIKDAKYIIVGTYTSSVSGRAPSASQMLMTNQLIATGIPVVAVGIRNPYDIMSYRNVGAYLVQYSYNKASFEASVNTIFGENNPTGKLPVTIYNQDGSILYNIGHGLEY